MAGIGTRKEIRLVQITPAKGSEGNWNAEIPSKHNTWAEINNVSQFRDYQNGQTQLGQSKKFKVRFRFDLYPGADWQIEYENKNWTVSSVVKENEKQFYWTLTASAK